MFVRFRQAGDRLQMSLIATSRGTGRVRHEHVAALGAIVMPPAPADRLAFWQRLHERLAKLSNRVDDATQAKVLAAIHARVPMVTPDEQRAVQLENAESDERFWSSLRDMHAGTVEDHRGLMGTAERVVATGQEQMAKADAARTIARDRIAKLKRGESVDGGLGKPVDFEKILRANGFTSRDIRRCLQMHELVGGDERVFKELMQEVHKRREQSERAALRAVRKRRGLG
jgi:hypothetical protein